MGLAAADEVLVSPTVKDLVVDSSFDLTDSGIHTLKGIEGAWQLCRLEV